MSRTLDKNNGKQTLLIIPNLGKGGAQKVFLEQFHFLSTQQNVTGCVFNWSGAFEADKLENIVSLDVPAGKHVISKFYFFLLRIIRLRKLKKKLNIQISISHLEGADYVNILSGVGERKILWIHGTKKFDEAIRGWIGYVRKSWLMPWLYKQADRVVTVSKAIAAELVSSYPELENKLQTVYNGVDLPRTQQLRKEEVSAAYQSFCEKNFVIITHCRLALQKNISGLIQVVAECKKKNLPVKWVIVGDGDLRNALTQQSEKMGIEYYAAWKNEAWTETKDVYFLGYQSNPYPFLVRAKLYVMPSGWEGFPLALCEALASGLPVMATDCYTGPREILAPGENVLPSATATEHAQYGILMPLINDRSISIWVEELSSLLTKPDELHKYIAKAEHRAQELSLERTLHQVQEVIDSV